MPSNEPVVTSANAARSRSLRLVASFAALYLIWGSTYLFIRFADETIPPFLMAGTRFVIAGAVLYLWARMRGAERPGRVYWKSTLVVGLLLLVGGNGGVVWAEQVLPSSVTALLISTVPIWIVLLDWLRPGGNVPTLPTIGGLLLGFAGVALLVTAGATKGTSYPAAGRVLRCMPLSCSWPRSRGQWAPSTRGRPGCLPYRFWEPAWRCWQGEPSS